MDEDVSGSVILDYALAIGHSIREKTEKVRPHLHEFEEWWLFLVDHLGTFDALDAEEIRQVECSISDLGGFARVGLVDVRGRRLLLDIQSS
jgi:hypothetical protein